jgi:hypothetical protein
MHRHGLFALGVVGVGVPLVVACGKSTADPPVATTAVSSATVRLSVAECQKLLDDSNAIDTAFWPNVDRSCKTAADCESTPYSALLAGCGGNYVNAAARGDVERAHTARVKSITDRWAKGDCGAVLPLPIPSCPAYFPSCDHGKCSPR